MKYLKSFEQYIDNTIGDFQMQALTQLSKLPNTLEILYCSNNLLKKLPTLPTTLEKLYCHFNKLTSLPELPSKLEYLKCSKNPLTELPKLSDSLRYLYCSDNLLTKLPELPNNLIELNCSHNKLKYLPILPDSLTSLKCNDNNWKEPIRYEYIIKFDLDPYDIYNTVQFKKFSKYGYQKDFLEKNPSRYEDLIPFEYAEGIKELFTIIFDAHSLGL